MQRRRESSWDRRELLWGKSWPGSICSYHIPATKHRHPAKKRNRSPFIIKGLEQLKSPTQKSLRRQEEQGFSQGGCVHASECKSKCTHMRVHTHTFSLQNQKSCTQSSVSRFFIARLRQQSHGKC